MAQAEVEAEPKAVERNWQSIIDRRRAYEQKKKKYADAVENADNAINNKAAAYEADEVCANPARRGKRY